MDEMRTWMNRAEILMDVTALILVLVFGLGVIGIILLDVWRGGPDNDHNDGCTM